MLNSLPGVVVVSGLGVVSKKHQNHSGETSPMTSSDFVDYIFSLQL